MGVVLRDRLATVLLERSIRRFLPGAAFRIESVHVGARQGVVRLAGVSWKTRGFSLEARDARLAVSYGWAPLGIQMLRAAALSAESVRVNDQEVRQLWVRAERLTRPCDFRIHLFAGFVSAGKIKATGFKGLFFINDRTVFSPRLEVRIAGGRATGDAQFFYREARAPLVGRLAFEGIELQEIINALEADKKIEAEGIFDGPIAFRFSSGEFQHLEGQLVSSVGGRFFIKDTSMIDPSVLGGQAGNIVIENLKNYYYDIGKVFAGLEGKNIKVRILLDGPVGQRDLEIFWHRGEQ